MMGRWRDGEVMQRRGRRLDGFVAELGKLAPTRVVLEEAAIRIVPVEPGGDQRGVAEANVPQHGGRRRKRSAAAQVRC